MRMREYRCVVVGIIGDTSDCVADGREMQRHRERHKHRETDRDRDGSRDRP